MDTAIARPELLLVADAVARDKPTDGHDVLEATEHAIHQAGRAKYRPEQHIRPTLHPPTAHAPPSRPHLTPPPPRPPHARSRPRFYAPA